MAYLPDSTRHAGHLTAILALDDCGQHDADKSDNEDQRQGHRSRLQIIFRRIEAQLSERLPPFGVPTFWLSMDHVPLTPSGKLARLRLREWADKMLDAPEPTFHDTLTPAESDAAESAPQTQVERSLRDALSETLQIGRDHIKLEHSFHQLHGDSIQAMKLVALLRHQKLSLTVKDVFRSPTLRDMAMCVTSSISSSTTKPFSLLDTSDAARLTGLLQEAAVECSLTLADIEDIYPATPVQETFWLAEIANPGTSYTRLVYRIADAVPIHKLQAAWRAVTSSHQILRTRLVHLSDRKTYQVVSRTEPPFTQVADWADAQSDDRQQQGAASRNLCSFAQAGPYVILGMHHACYDNFSLQLVIDDLIRACYGDPLAQLPVFRDFIRVAMDPAKTASGERFWRQTLSGARETQFPHITGKVAELATSMKWTSLVFTQSRYTIATVVNAAWALLLSTCEGSNDVTFGSISSGRDAPVDNIARMPGPTMCTMPLRCVVKSTQPVQHLLHDVEQRSLDAMEHQHFGMQNIARIGPYAKSACSFHTYVNILPPRSAAPSARWTLDHAKSRNPLANFARYDLTIQVFQNSEGAELCLLYSPSLLSEQQADCVFQAYQEMFIKISTAGDGIVVADVVPPSLVSLGRTRQDIGNGLAESQAFRGLGNMSDGQAEGDQGTERLANLVSGDGATSDAPRSSSDYWRHYLSDCDPCCVPSDRDDYLPADTTEVSAKLEVSKLNEFCRGYNVDTSDVVSAAWALLLASYTGEVSTCYGYFETSRSPLDTSGQSPTGTAMTTCMLARRIEIDPTESVVTLAHRIRGDRLRSLPHSSVAVDSMLHGISSSASIFNTVIATRGYIALPTFGEIGIHVERVDNANVAQRIPVPWDLFLDVSGDTGGLILHLMHSRNIGPNFALRITKTFVSILTTMLSVPGAYCSQPDLTSAYDKSQVMSWNCANIEPDHGYDFVHSLITAQAHSTPNQPAVVAWDGTLSYNELDRMSTNLAHHLVSLGIKTGDSVPYCLEKSVWTPMVIVAIMKSGAMFSPLDPEDPIERQTTLLEKCAARALIVCSSRRKKFVDLAIPIMVADPQFFNDLPERHGAACNDLRPESLVYALFTSGSTGESKTVLEPHSAWLAFNRLLKPLLLYKPGMKALQFASHVWDVSLSELITPLVYGGTTYIPAEETRLYDLTAFINQHRINWVYVTPSVARTLVPTEVPSLDTLILVGEPVRQNDLQQWQAHVRLRVHYGACEMGAYTTMAEFENGSRKSPRNIGRGENGNRFFLVDPRNPQRLAPIGAIGEIMCEGPHLAVGYLNDEQKTAENFVEGLTWIDGSSGNRKRRAFRTGDLARYNADGSMHYIARKGGFVKLRGQKLELGDIEEKVLRCPSVRHTLCAVPTQGSLARRLVCLVVLADAVSSKAAAETIVVTDSSLRPDVSEDIEQIRNCVSKTAPAYARPDVWVVVEALPFNTSRKISRKRVHEWLAESRLDALSSAGPSAPTPISGQGTENEQRLQALWAEVLDIPLDQTRIDRSFLSHGGDSISSIRLVSALRRAGFSATPADVLKGLTIADIAHKSTHQPSALDSVGDAESKPAVVEGEVSLDGQKYIDNVLIPPNDSPGLGKLHALRKNGNIEAVHHCSPLQDGMITSKASSPDRYTLSMIVRLRRKGTDGLALTPAQLEAAWTRVVAQHQMLRTLFLDSSSMATLHRQVVLGRYSPKTTMLHAQSEKDAISILRSHNLPIEEQQPPHHLAICGVSDSHAVLCRLDISHACVDALSLLLLWRDLSLACDSKLPSREIPTYGMYVDDMRRNIDSSTAAQYWREQLRTTIPCNISVAPPRSDRTQNSATYLVPFTGISQLQSFCRTTSLTAASVIRAAWAMVLSLCTGQESCCFGYVSSGRDHATLDLREVVGPFLNVLLCTAMVSGHQSVCALIADMQASFIESLPHQFAAFTPFAQKSLRGGGRLFNTLVSVWPSAFLPEATYSSVEYEGLQMRDPTEYDLALNAILSAASPKIELAVDMNRFSASQARRIAAMLGQILQSTVAAGPAATIDSVCTFSEDV